MMDAQKDRIAKRVDAAIEAVWLVIVQRDPKKDATNASLCASMIGAAGKLWTQPHDATR